VQSSSQIITANKPTPSVLQADAIPVAQPTVVVVVVEMNIIKVALSRAVKEKNTLDTTTYWSIGVGGRRNPDVLVCGGGGILRRVLTRRAGELRTSRRAGTLVDGGRWLSRWRRFTGRRRGRYGSGLRRRHPAHLRRRSAHCRLLRPAGLGNLRQPGPLHRQISGTATACSCNVLAGHRRLPLIGRRRRVAGFSGSPRTGRGGHLELLLCIVRDVRRLGVIRLARQRRYIVGGF